MQVSIIFFMNNADSIWMYLSMTVNSPHWSGKNSTLMKHIPIPAKEREPANIETSLE